MVLARMSRWFAPTNGSNGHGSPTGAVAAADEWDATSEFGGLYRMAARQSLGTRNPVIVIPGIMGSRLVATAGRRSIWGDFSGERPSLDDNARLIALPMEQGRSLDQLVGDGQVDGSLADFRCKFAGIPLRRRIYGNVLAAMGVKAYAEAGDEAAEDGTTGSAAAFEFDYDWRRSLDESAIRLQRFIKQLGRFIRSHRDHREPLRFDIVAHSMGGLLIRYYLQYGGQLLPYDGSPPRSTWEGAAHIENVILVGTPNAGSVDSFRRLLSGMAGNIVLPPYHPAIVGTMPSLYQLLPRQRHRPLELADSNDAADPLDAEIWLRQGWGLANAACDDMLAVLCPGQDSVAGRREVALDHLSKCLQSARALQTALDAPPQGRPPHLKLHLFASDSLATAAAMRSTGRGDMPKVSRQGPGDGVVLRSSALLDERAGAPWKARLRSPIAWDSVTFVPGTHLGITHHPVTVDNVLYLLLDQPLS